MRSFIKKTVVVLICIAAFMMGASSVKASSTQDDSLNTEEIGGDFTQQMVEELELDEVQQLMDDLLGKNSFSLMKSLGEIIRGEQPFSKDTFMEIAYEAVFGEIQQHKQELLQIILLVLAAALFSNFASAFEKGQIGEISFYVVYLVLFAILINSFNTLGISLQKTLQGIIGFLKIATPSYFLAAAAANGLTTATLFYEFIILLVLGIQVIVIHIILPCINLYVLLELVNNLSKEEMLSKLAELLKTVVEWSLKTILGVMVGMQVVQSLVAPVIDTLKRTAIGKTASAIPGVGNAINSVTEVILTSAVLVRNSLGVVFLVAFILWGITPLVKYAVIGILYKLLAALAQPISDKRIVSCINTIGDGSILLLRTLFTVQILCMISFVVIMGTLT